MTVLPTSEICDRSVTKSTDQCKLNLGCGPVQPSGWINVDGSNRAWLATHLGLLDRLLTSFGILSPTEFNSSTKYVNLDRRFPWQDNSIAAIYIGEVLEHFTREKGSHLLVNCYRVLKPGGVLRVRVPDNAQFWANYLAEYESVLQKPRSERTMDHTRWIGMFFRDICVTRPWYSSMGHYHKWMYDEVSLIKTLEEQGFIQVERRAYLDSQIEDIDRVEVRDNLIVEAIKP
ncbi:MAG TPA: methyltransferase domain-containing protein [Gemmataceae bacterium]|nr:methyltransferase domain-containing protein [Gemmataceae bacterium]